MKKLLLILLCVPLIGLGQGWEKTYGGGNTDYGYSVQQTTDGGYIITGTGLFGNIDDDIYLIKTNSIGDSLWVKTFGGTNIDIGYSVHQTTDGGYIITGIKNWNPFSPSLDSSNVWLIKTDGNGNEQWTKTFGGTNHDEGRSVQQTTDGGYIICGSTSSFGNVFDVYLIKTDINGVEQWNQTFGGNGDNFGYSVQQTTDDGFIITGSYQNSLGTERKVYLIKTDSQGNITSTFNILIPSSTRKLEKVIDILGRETKPKLNTPFIEIYDDGTVEKKTIIE